MALESATLPSLIQGVSQQADISRGSASAEAQENCLNEVLDGVVSRLGSVHKATISQAYTDPFFHEYIRNPAEHYVFVIESGDLKIINLATGTTAAVTGSISAYLAHSGNARDAFRAVTVGDTTFLLNRQKTVAMASTTAASRPNQGVIWIRAGAYRSTYSVSLRVTGVASYSASYTTPDNSDVANALYINTDRIAQELVDVLEGTTFPAISGAGGGTFTCTRYGSVIVITGPSNQGFNLEGFDGGAETRISAFTHTVRDISELPKKCVDGYVVRVASDGSPPADHYYLEFESYTGAYGNWMETIAPGAKTDLSNTTMPVTITCTALNTFTASVPTWGKRVAGNGTDNAKDPSFVGKKITDLQFISGRLALSTSYTTVLSRARNAYVFFPDTVQTRLDTAPVDYDVSNGSSTNITHMVVAGGKLQFWGHQQQTYMDHGQDPIREDTVEALPLANYDFAGTCNPAPIGLASVMFGTTVGSWGKVTEVFFRNGRGDGEITISAHVPKYIPGAIRHIITGEGAGKAFILSEGAPKAAYFYQWYNQGDQRVQSAWNTWTFPYVDKVLWGTISGNTAWFAFKCGDKLTFESVIMARTGDEVVDEYTLRLDHRHSEANATYSDGEWTLNLPYTIAEDDRPNFEVYERVTDEDKGMLRGRTRPFTWTSGSAIKVAGDADLKFYFGTIPVARRKFSRFYAKDRQDQPIIHDKLRINKVVIKHDRTTTYKVVVTNNEGVHTETFVGRVLGDPNLLNNQVAVKTGAFVCRVNAETEDADIELINDTAFPAVWTAARYVYELTLSEK